MTMNHTNRQLLVSIGVAICFLAGSLSPAWGSYFSGYTLNDLTVVEMDVEAGTVMLEAPDGETAYLSVGDTVGMDDFSIIGIYESCVYLESQPDDEDRTTKATIPRYRFLREDSLFIINSPLKKP